MRVEEWEAERDGLGVALRLREGDAEREKLAEGLGVSGARAAGGGKMKTYLNILLQLNKHF